MEHEHKWVYLESTPDGKEPGKISYICSVEGCGLIATFDKD